MDTQISIQDILANQICGIKEAQNLFLQNLDQLLNSKTIANIDKEDRIGGRRANSFLFLALDDLEMELSKIYNSCLINIQKSFKIKNSSSIELKTQLRNQEEEKQPVISSLETSRSRSLNLKNFNFPQRKFVKTNTKSEETKVLSPKQMQEEFLKSFDSQIDEMKRIENLKNGLEILDFKEKIDTKQSCKIVFNSQIIVKLLLQTQKWPFQPHIRVLQNSIFRPKNKQKQHTQAVKPL